MDLTLKQLQEINVRRSVSEGHLIEDWSPTDWGCAMAGEAGEACNLLEKMLRGEDIDVEEVGDELADVIIYVSLTYSRLGIDMSKSVTRKFNAVSDRWGNPIKIEDAQ